MPTVVGVLVEYTRVVLPAVFLIGWRHTLNSGLLQSGCMLVHCWVSGALLSWCCPVIDTVMVCLRRGCCWWLGCCVRTV